MWVDNNTKDCTKKCRGKKSKQDTDSEKATLEYNHADNRFNEIFNSRLVQSIREATANIEKISSFECEDMENQDPEDVF